MRGASEFQSSGERGFGVSVRQCALGMRARTVLVVAASLFLMARAPWSHEGSAAGAECNTSSPSPAYSVTLCIDEPAAGANLSGASTVRASATVEGEDPGVRRVVFSLDDEYVLTDFSAPFEFTMPTDHWTDGAYTLQARALMRDDYVTDPAKVEVTLANGVTEAPVNSDGFTIKIPAPPAAGKPLVVAAAGDGAAGEPADQQVTDLIASWDPALLLYLGDVYERGTYTEFMNWYEPATSYGRFNEITNPTIGNHERGTPGGAGYFQYWDNVPAYYAYEAAGWQFIVLDTSRLGGLNPGDEQYQWLAEQLDEDAPCAIVYSHHPRFSIGPHGDNTELTALWSLLAEKKVEFLLSGHDHNYQRWRPMDATGKVAQDGVTQFVVGSGGHGIRGATLQDERLAAFADGSHDFGALKLELYPGRADFAFFDTTGARRDSGSVTCAVAEPDTSAPSAPAQLTAERAGASIALRWRAATDDRAVSGYQVFRDGSLLATVGEQTAYLDTDTQPGRAHEYTTKALDAAGNLSAPSDTASASPGGILFGDDFESGDLSAWTAVEGLGIDKEAFESTYGARAAGRGNSAFATKDLTAPQHDVYYGFRFRLQEEHPSINLAKLRTADGAALLGLFVTDTARLGYRNEVAGASVTSALSSTSETWHSFQVHLLVDGDASRLEVWLDGRIVDDLSGGLALGDEPVGQVQLGENLKDRTYDVAFDDLVVSTNQDVVSRLPAPTGVRAVVTGANVVEVSWDPVAQETVSGYTILRDGNPLATVFGETVTFTDTTVEPGKTYGYSVAAVDAAQHASELSAPVSVSVGEQPAGTGTEGPNSTAADDEGPPLVLLTLLVVVAVAVTYAALAILRRARGADG